MTDKTIEPPSPAAHIFPSDLEKVQESETFCIVYSVAVSNPDESSVPLITISDCVEYAQKMSEEERASMLEILKQLQTAMLDGAPGEADRLLDKAIAKLEKA